MKCFIYEWEEPKPRYMFLLEGASKAQLEANEPPDLWTPPPDSKIWFPCEDKGPNVPFVAGNVSGFLLATCGLNVSVFLEGGLNQQRFAICDAVDVAKLLEVMLILPQFDKNPFWQDSR